MWSSRRFVRIVMIGLVLLAPAATLSGCTGFTPVYGENGLGAERIALRYGSPGSRTEQIIYQALSLKLGKSADSGVPRLSISTSQSSRDLTTESTAVPSQQREMTVSAVVDLADADGKVLFSGTRKASALYTSGPQILANQAAEADAAERAARTLAETIRLTILSVLSTPAQ